MERSWDKPVKELNYDREERETEKKVDYQERREWILIRFSEKSTNKPQSILMQS